MSYGNIITGQIKNGEFDQNIVVDGSPMMNVGFAHWQAQGWRIVQSVDDPTAGYRVLTYAPEEIDATYCKLIVATEKNLAEEPAEQEAAEAAALAQRLVDFDITNKELFQIIMGIRNANIPEQYQVTIQEGKDIAEGVLYG